MTNLETPNQLTFDYLSLECYLQLKQSQKLLDKTFISSKLDLFQTFPNIYHQLKAINILIPLGSDDLENLSESDLEILIKMIAQDPHRSWLGFLWIVPEGYQEDFEAYLGLMNGGLELIDAEPLTDYELIILDLPHLQECWANISHRIDGYWSLNSILDHDLITPDYLTIYGDIFTTLPSFSWDDDRTLIECLYDARLQYLDGLDKQASNAFAQSDYPKAIDLYKTIVSLNPINPNNWANLGNSYFKQDEFLLAKDCLEQAIYLNPSNWNYFNSLGLIYENLQQPQIALTAYRSAIQSDPKQGDSYCNLGSLLVKLSQHEVAEQVYQEGIAANPWHYGLYLNFGNLLVLMGRNSEAIQSYKKAKCFQAYDSDLFFNMAIAYKDKPLFSQYYYAKSLQEKENYQDALSIYQKIIETNPFFPTAEKPEVHFDVLHCSKKLGYHSKLFEIMEKSIKTYLSQENKFELDFLFVRRLLGYFTGQGDHQKVQDLIMKLNLFSLKSFNDLFAQLHLPIIYENQSEVIESRQSFESTLKEMEKLDFSDEKAIEEGYPLVKSLLNFYITYQNFNDLEIQQQSSNFMYEILTRKKPHFSNLVNPRPNLNVQHNKIKIGYISNHLEAHAGTMGILGWIKNHDRDQFEVYAYHLGTTIDKGTEGFANSADYFQQITNDDRPSFDAYIETVIEAIQADQLDILVFTDVGMDMSSILLSRLRLAPIQCVLWGHPTTTGSKTIDYFLTASSMEPKDAHTHYSERLVHLPNISWSYPIILLPEEEKTRHDFELPEDRILYFSCQSLFKYLPEQDYIYPAIAQRVPQAYFMFLNILDVAPIFWKRLKQAFAAVGLEAKDYCRILPRQSSDNFLSLQGLSDIYLDTLTWSGGNTTLQAASWPIPVVTCPNKFMRSRHSYGILKTMGVTETIAHSEAEYIEIASELGLNPQWRSSIIEKMKDRKYSLYNDLQCVEAVDKFFKYAYQKYHASR